MAGATGHIGIQILGKLLELEYAIRDLYMDFAGRDKELAAFWLDMVTEEDVHVNWVQHLVKQVREGKARFVVGPLNMREIERRISAIRHHRAEHARREGELPSVVALGCAVGLERALAESRFYESVSSDDPALQKFQLRMAESIRDHVSRVEAALNQVTQTAAIAICEDSVAILSSAERDRDSAHADLQRLREHEGAMASLYTALAARFPEHDAFWSQLSQEESGHAAFLLDLDEAVDEEELRPVQSLAVVEDVEASLAFVQGSREHFARGNGDMQQALLAARFLELGMLEHNFFELFGEDAALWHDRFQRLRIETQAHLRKIEERMAFA